MEHNKLRAPFETEEVENNWAISYGDMITLLLGFFVIFFNIRPETMNINLLKKDLDKYFDSAQKTEAGKSIASIDESGQKTAPILTSDISNIVPIKSNIEGERILVEFPGISFFDSASHHLTQPGKEALGRFAQAINGHLGLFRLVVRGYTDANPIHPGSLYQDNLELSAFRSISAIRYLASKGINLENMRIAGYGESSKSRAEKGDPAFDKQRKVAIVIEPLDHTEKAPISKPEEFSKNGQAIESVPEAQIIERELASQKSFNIKSWMAQQWSAIPTKQRVEYEMNEVLIKIDQKIEESSLYQKYLEYLIKSGLRADGYSEKKIDELMKRRKNKGGVRE